MILYVVTKQVFTEHPYDEGELFVGLAIDGLVALQIVENDATKSEKWAISRGAVLDFDLTASTTPRVVLKKPESIYSEAVWFVQQVELAGICPTQ